MKKIPLTQGKFAIVDDEDFPILSRHSWQYKNSIGVVHSTWKKEKSPYQMQDWIISKRPDCLIMFKNRNPLDLRKDNLVEVHRGTPRHYGFKRRGKNTSEYKGVCWFKKDKRWVAQINFNKKHYRIGAFKNEKDAALAYNKKASELYGEFAYQNKI